MLKYSSFLLFVTIFLNFSPNDSFLFRPESIAAGPSNSWIYFGRGLNQKEIIDLSSKKIKEKEIFGIENSTTTTTTLEPSTMPSSSTTTMTETTATTDAPVPTTSTTTQTTTSPTTSKTLETTEKIRNLPESVQTENIQTTEISTVISESTTETTEVESLSTISEIVLPTTSKKLKIVVIPKELTVEPLPSPEEASTIRILPSTIDPESKPEIESSSSSEEVAAGVKPDLSKILTRVYRGNGPLHKY